MKAIKFILLCVLLCSAWNVSYSQSDVITMESLLENISNPQLELGSLDLNEGKNKFEIVFEGKSPNADQAFFGWDYIDFEKQK